jgi:hypothetical protein
VSLGRSTRVFAADAALLADGWGGVASVHGRSNPP